MKHMLAYLAVLAALASSTSAAAKPAQKASLTRTNRECNGQPNEPPKTETFGFVNLVRTGSDKLVANVVLQGGTPNAQFNVRLIQIKYGQAVDCGKCTEEGGTLATDSSGNGNLNIQDAVNSGATSAWVALNDKTQCSNFYTIGPLSIV
ncbi:uncharacterized protein BO97DRAFT_450089, partial [Aspergillus homomorphus CBS 101889]